MNESREKFKKSALLYGTEIDPNPIPLKQSEDSKMKMTDISIARWVFGKTRRDKKLKIRRTPGVTNFKEYSRKQITMECEDLTIKKEKWLRLWIMFSYFQYL